MTHGDPELLAMMAMDDVDVPASAATHIAECPECRAELASLRRVTDLARSGGPDDALGAPSPVVWSRISAELGLSADVAGSAQVGSVRAHGRRARRRSWIALVAAAAAVAAIATAVTIGVQQRVADQVLATARLDALPGWEGASGDAALEESVGGGRDIRVRVDAAAAASDGYREVWLLSEDSTGLISLGVLDGAEGRFALPDGVELADYPVVDVSREQLDGDPAHSGDSIVRGSLST